MRMFCSFFLLSLVGIVSAEWAVAQEKTNPSQETTKTTETPEEPVSRETLAKLRLTLNIGGHTDRINKVLFTPDGNQVITMGNDASIRFWDAHTGRGLKVLYPPGSEGLNVAAVSPDGRLLAVASHYREKGKNVPLVWLIALPEGRIDRVLRGHTGNIEGLSFSPDSQRLATCDSTVRIWDLAGNTPPKIIPPHPGYFLDIAFSPDGERMARVHRDSNSTPHCQIIDLATAKVGTDVEGGDVAWSPDGKTLATAGGKGGMSLRLWEPNGKLRFHLLNKEGQVKSVAFSGDSRTVLATWRTGQQAEMATVFDVATGKELMVFKGGAWGGALSPDGQLAVTTGGAVRGHHDAFLWKTADGKLVRNLGVSPWIGGSIHGGWSADGQSIAWDKNRSFHLDTLEFGPPLADKDFKGAVLARGPLSLQRKQYNVYNIMKDGKVTAELKWGAWGFDDLTLVGTNRIVLCSWDGLALFDATTGKFIRQYHGHRSVVFSVAASPDGRYLLSFSDDQTACIWDLERGTLLLTLYVHGRDWIAWTPKGYYAASPGGEKLMGWVVDNGPNELSSFHPAQRFRKQLYRPDLIKLVFEKGSFIEAVKAANVRPQDIAKILPPKATLRVVQQDGTKAEVEVVAEAGSPGQPVAELHLLVDGRPAKLEGDKPSVQKIDPPLEKDAQAKWTVLLDPGAHKLSVCAYAKDAYSISDEVAIEVKAATPPSRKHGTLYYFGIGVNQLQYLANLNLTGAVPDVHAMQKCLTTACADRFEKIEAATLCDEQATRAAILKKLADLQAQVQPADVVIVHFSCHGEVGEDGGLYLICYDAKLEDLKGTAVSGQELRDQLGQYTCPVLLLLDACHSGKFPLRSPTDGLSRLLADDSCGVAVMTAALAHQTAEDRAQGGVFTEGIVKGLSGGAPPDGVSKRLYVHNLFGYVYSFVTQETSNRQMPVYLPSGSVPPIVLKE